MTVDDESAKINVTFEDLKEITLYRKGEKTEFNGNGFDITLDNEEGIFVLLS